MNGYSDISIEISTVNTDELVNLDFEISYAGESYRYLPKNHFEGLISNISTTNSLTLTWHSLMEIRDNQDKVRLRITPLQQMRKVTHIKFNIVGKKRFRE